MAPHTPGVLRFGKFKKTVAPAGYKNKQCRKQTSVLSGRTMTAYVPLRSATERERAAFLIPCQGLRGYFAKLLFSRRFLPGFHNIHNGDHHIRTVDKTSDPHEDGTRQGDKPFFAHANTAADGTDAGEQDRQKINEYCPQEKADAPDTHGKSDETQDKVHDISRNLNSFDDQVHPGSLPCSQFSPGGLYRIDDYDDKGIQVIDDCDDKQDKQGDIRGILWQYAYKQEEDSKNQYINIGIDNYRYHFQIFQKFVHDNSPLIITMLVRK